MTREQVIREIEALFPADSIYEETAAIGQQLLEQAKRRAEDWRNLPDAVLFEYMRLCREADRTSLIPDDRPDAW